MRNLILSAVGAAAVALATPAIAQAPTSVPGVGIQTGNEQGQIPRNFDSSAYQARAQAELSSGDRSHGASEWHRIGQEADLLLTGLPSNKGLCRKTGPRCASGLYRDACLTAPRSTDACRASATPYPRPSLAAADE